MIGRVCSWLKSLRRPRRALVAAVVLALLTSGGYFGGRHLWAEHHYREAQAALERYAFAEARGHLAACLEVWPDGPATHFLAAQTARRDRRFEEALQHLRRCQRLGFSADAIALEHLLLRGQRGDAQALLELQGRVRAAEAETPLVLEVLIQDYIDTFQLHRALDALNLLLERRPNNLKALLGRGWVYERLFDFGAAARDYRAAVQAAPENDDARGRLAETLLITGPPGECLAEFERLRQRRGPTPAVLVGLARCRAQLGQFGEARELLDRLLADHPGSVPGLTERGKVALELGRSDDAERWLKKALAEAPQDREVNYSLYRSLVRAGRKQEAAQYFKRFQELDAALKRLDRLTRQVMKRPGDADLRCEVGLILLRLGEPTEGVRWLASALRQDPRHRRTHEVLARHYRAAGRPDLAETHERLAEGSVVKGGS